MDPVFRGVDYRADEAHRLVEGVFGWFRIQPLFQLTISRAAGVDPARAGEVHDQTPFRGADPGFGPRHLKDRDEQQERDRLRGEAELGQLAQRCGVVNASLLLERPALSGRRVRSPQVFDQLAVLPPEYSSSCARMFSVIPSWLSTRPSCREAVRTFRYDAVGYPFGHF